jgi:hypothetical protein
MLTAIMPTPKFKIGQTVFLRPSRGLNVAGGAYTVHKTVARTRWGVSVSSEKHPRATRAGRARKSVERRTVARLLSPTAAAAPLSRRGLKRIDARRRRSGSLLILSLYNIIICLVATTLYVAVDNLEPNRRYASVLKILIVTLAFLAILAHLMRSAI